LSLCFRQQKLEVVLDFEIEQTSYAEQQRSPSFASAENVRISWNVGRGSAILYRHDLWFRVSCVMEIGSSAVKVANGRQKSVRTMLVSSVYVLESQAHLL
jgi:hypothetical protein